MTPTYTLYKMDISYFSGKVEAYLRYKGIPYDAVDCLESIKNLHYVGERTGTQKVPAIELSNGQWLNDSTPMLQWLESHHPERRIYPTDPALNLIALLIEHYADEWLWRPAMWWRWVPKVSRASLGRQIAKVYLPILAIPLGYYFGRRQLREWLWDDGVTPENNTSVRDMFFEELEFLESALSVNPYLLGSHPSIADFGYFGPFFRHFGNDPVSAEVMRRRGPNTYEWLARLWNSGSKPDLSEIRWAWPSEGYWGPLFERLCCDYLPYLHQNAVAFKDGKQRFDFHGKSKSFPKTVTTHYRVWYRSILQARFGALSEGDQSRVKDLLAPYGGLESLLADGDIESGLDNRLKLPIDPSRVSSRPGLLRRYLGQPRN